MKRQALLSGLIMIVALGGGAASAEPGPFTEQQAADGKTKFNNHCATCHRSNLEGGQGTALIGDAFKQKWAGKPVAELRDYIHATMPPTAPRSLADDQLDPITAYILSKNGVAPGDAPLSKDNASAAFPK